METKTHKVTWLLRPNTAKNIPVIVAETTMTLQKSLIEMQWRRRSEPNLPMVKQIKNTVTKLTASSLLKLSLLNTQLRNIKNIPNQI